MQNSSYLRPTAAVACPQPAGGATFHHFRTLHFTAANTTDEPRLAFPMEFQLKPVPRKGAPAPMPWVDERRAATGEGKRAPVYVADGTITPL